MNTSDKRLKAQVEPYRTGLEDLCQLPVVKYVYRQGSILQDAGKPHVGIFAQDLQKVFPMSVMMQSNGFLGVDQSELVYALVQTVQDLRFQVEHLAKMVVDLKLGKEK